MPNLLGWPAGLEKENGVRDVSTAGWQTHGACIGQPERWFFPNGGGTNATHAYNKGRQVCAHCPVRNRCLTEAMRMEGWLDAQWRFGLWGGLTPGERVELMRRTA